MSENTEHGICATFCQKLGKTGIETYELLSQVFGDEAMSRTSAFEWHRRFREGRQSVASESVQDDLAPARSLRWSGGAWYGDEK